MKVMKMSKGQAMRKAKATSIDTMVSKIESRVCVRKIWRANAGWAMSFVLTDLQARALNAQGGRERDDYCAHGIIFAYYDTLEDCVRAEYTVWVLGCERPKR